MGIHYITYMDRVYGAELTNNHKNNNKSNKYETEKMACIELEIHVTFVYLVIV